MCVSRMITEELPSPQAVQQVRMGRRTLLGCPLMDSPVVYGLSYQPRGRSPPLSPLRQKEDRRSRFDHFAGRLLPLEFVPYQRSGLDFNTAFVCFDRKA